MKRALFLTAAALLAAAIANPIVESIANSGVFGGGYADHDQSSVGPTLAIAALFALAFIVARTVRMLSRASSRSHSQSMLSSIASDLARRAPASDLPFVIGLQFCALYAMERVECFANGGMESGLAWLGGPVLFAVTVHALIGVGVTFALGYALRFCARLLATAVRAVLEAIALVRARTAAAAFAPQTFDAIAGLSLVHVRAIRGRAPPYAPTRA